MIWPITSNVIQCYATLDGVTYQLSLAPENADRTLGIGKQIPIAPSETVTIKEIHIYEEYVQLTVVPYRSVGEKIREAEERARREDLEWIEGRAARWST